MLGRKYLLEFFSCCLFVVDGDGARGFTDFAPVGRLPVSPFGVVGPVLGEHHPHCGVLLYEPLSVLVETKDVFGCVL